MYCYRAYKTFRLEHLGQWRRWGMENHSCEVRVKMTREALILSVKLILEVLGGIERVRAMFRSEERCCSPLLKSSVNYQFNQSLQRHVGSAARVLLLLLHGPVSSKINGVRWDKGCRPSLQPQLCTRRVQTNTPLIYLFFFTFSNNVYNTTYTRTCCHIL